MQEDPWNTHNSSNDNSSFRKARRSCLIHTLWHRLLRSFFVKDGQKERNAYGLMITCLSSRAVHIELLEDMSSDAFINALCNLISIRGAMSTIRCDQGTNFVGAFNDLAKKTWRVHWALHILTSSSLSTHHTPAIGEVCGNVSFDLVEQFSEGWGRNMVAG